MTNNTELALVRPDLLVDSRTIAERLENQHASTMLLIQNNLPHFEGFGQVRFEIGTVTNSVGAVNQTRYALLNEDQCYFLLSLSRNNETVVALKAGLVQAFRQARDSARPALDMSDPLILAQHYVESETHRRVLAGENHALTEAVEALSPKAASFDRYLSTEGVHDFKVAANMLGWGRNRMLEELRRKKILISDGRHKNLPYQRFIDEGYFKVKARTVMILGLDEVTTTTFVTPRGVVYLNRLLDKPPVVDTTRPPRPRQQGQTSKRLTAPSISPKQSLQRE